MEGEKTGGGQGQGEGEGAGAVASPTATTPTVYTTLKFDFTLHTIKTVIYQGDNQLVSVEGSVSFWGLEYFRIHFRDKFKGFMAIFGCKNFNTRRFKRKLFKFANVFCLTRSRFVHLFRLIPEFHGYWNWVRILSGGFFSGFIAINQRKKIHRYTESIY